MPLYSFMQHNVTHHSGPWWISCRQPQITMVHCILLYQATVASNTLKHVTRAVNLLQVWTWLAVCSWPYFYAYFTNIHMWKVVCEAHLHWIDLAHIFNTTYTQLKLHDIVSYQSSNLYEITSHAKACLPVVSRLAHIYDFTCVLSVLAISMK